MLIKKTVIQRLSDLDTAMWKHEAGPVAQLALYSGFL